MPKLFTLSANERIKSRKDIETLFQTGKAFLIFPFRVLYRIEASTSEKSVFQCMVSVPKRNFKKATERNRIRRQTKEAIRLQKVDLQTDLNNKQHRLVCAFIFQGKELPTYEKVHRVIGRSLQQLREHLSPQL